MKTVILLSVCFFAHVAISLAASIPEDAQATIIQYYNTNDGNGIYEFRFLTSNGIERKETGTLVNIGQPNEHIEVEGEVSYTGPDGNIVIINYTAGEKGYQVVETLPSLVPIVPLAGVSPNLVASLLGK